MVIRTSISDVTALFMTRVFAYCRVSTADQPTDNQVQKIAASGFMVIGPRTITETVSGSVAAMERNGFLALINKLETGDVLVVTKFDRLGRNAMDVRSTVEHLSALGVRVHCLALWRVRFDQPSRQDDHGGNCNRCRV